MDNVEVAMREAAAALRFHWFLPTNGDGRDIVGGGHGVATGAAGPIRPATLQYLGQVARAAEQLGFEGALTPTGAWCEDAWLATAMLAGVYERPAEFLDIVTRLWRGETVTAAGAHLRVEGARLARLPEPVPDIYFGGSSHAAGPVAARDADPHLTWGEPPHAVDSKLRWIEALAAKESPAPPRFGIRLHVITRDTADEAWRVADRLLERVDDATVRAVQEGLARSESEGQRRMRALHQGGDRRGLTVAPNLWAGIGLVRGGAGTALVGSHAEVADRIEEYASLGISEFILSGYPHLEEAYWFGEGVLPELRRRGRWRPPAPAAEAPQTISPFAPTHVREPAAAS